MFYFQTFWFFRGKYFKFHCSSVWWLAFLGQVAGESVVLKMIGKVGKVHLISQRGEGCGS